MSTYLVVTFPVTLSFRIGGGTMWWCEEPLNHQKDMAGMWRTIVSTHSLFLPIKKWYPRHKAKGPFPHILSSWGTLWFILILRRRKERPQETGNNHMPCLGVIGLMCLACFLSPLFSSIYGPMENLNWGEHKWTPSGHHVKGFCTFFFLKTGFKK